MVEHLTERIEANPLDTEALAARGLAYSELGEHRLAAADNGSVIALDPDNASAYFGRARAYAAMGEHRLAVETTPPPSAWLRAMPWRTATGGRATRNWAT